MKRLLATLLVLGLVAGCSLLQSAYPVPANVVKLRLDSKDRLTYANGSTSLSITEPSASATTRIEITGGTNSANLSLANASDGKELWATTIEVRRGLDNDQPTGNRTVSLPPGTYEFHKDPGNIATNVLLTISVTP